MAIRTVLQYPHTSLRTKTEIVNEVTTEINTLIDDMIETMREAHGCGLAANQIGVSKSILIADPSPEDNNPHIFINPEIIEEEGSVIKEEGCLSFPGIFAKVKRAEKVKVRYLDRKGNIQEIEADDFLGHILQHEIDHLKGKVFIDHLSSLKRRMALKKLEKLRRETM